LVQRDNREMESYTFKARAKLRQVHADKKFIKCLWTTLKRVKLVPKDGMRVTRRVAI
jgi:hypothetical protein